MRVASHASLIRRCVSTSQAHMPTVPKTDRVFFLGSPRAEDTPSGSDEDSHHDSQMGEGLVHEDSEDDAEMYDYTTQVSCGLQAARHEGHI